MRTQKLKQSHSIARVNYFLESTKVEKYAFKQVVIYKVDKKNNRTIIDRKNFK